MAEPGGVLGSIAARPQTRGVAAGPVVALAGPLSFWGGVDHSGTVVGAHHPDRGRSLAGAVLVMTVGRGSSSSSSVLAELIRAGHAPAAIVLTRPDPIIALGCLVAAELYDLAVPVATVPDAALPVVALWSHARVESDPDAGIATVSRRRA